MDPMGCRTPVACLFFNDSTVARSLKRFARFVTPQRWQLRSTTKACLVATNIGLMFLQTSIVNMLFFVDKKCSWEYVFRIVGIISVSLSFIDFVILRYLYIFCLSVYLFMHLSIDCCCLNPHGKSPEARCGDRAGLHGSAAAAWAPDGARRRGMAVAKTVGRPSGMGIT